jgi:hypothetical protein
MKRPSVEDTILIHDLYSRYAWALDTGDSEGYVRLYTPDGVVYETRTDEIREARGHDSIRGFIGRFHNNRDYVGMQHHTSQLVIVPDPEGRRDHWLCRSYAFATDVDEGGHFRLHWYGYATDTVAKIGDEWFLASRRIGPWAGEILEGFNV